MFVCYNTIYSHLFDGQQAIGNVREDDDGDDDQ